MNTIPYQKCPLCEGTGLDPRGGTFSGAFPPCPVCKGAMIILQYYPPQVPELSIVHGEQREYKGSRYTMLHYVNLKIGQSSINCIAYFSNDDPNIYYAREAIDFNQKFKLP